MTRAALRLALILSCAPVLFAASVRPAAAQPSPMAPTPADAPTSPEVGPPAQPPSYTLVADPGERLAGVEGVRLIAVTSAPEADACQIVPAEIEAAAAETLRTAGIPVLETGRPTDPTAAAALPEVFVALTVIRDETGICAASLLVQLGVETNVVLLHRNADAAPGTLRLSNAFAELDRSGTLQVGVPPTFGTEVRRAVAGEVSRVAAAIRAANPARPNQP